MQWALRHPELLPLLSLVALPLLVHLISKRRAREVRFAPMEFVLRSQKRSARRLQLRQWLLLLARTLMLAALAMAVVGPYMQREQARGAQSRSVVRHVFAVDVSASMLARVGGEPRWKVAVEAAQDALKQLAPEESVAVVACGGVPTALVEPPTFDRAVADGALASIKGGLEKGDLPSCLMRAKAAVGSGLDSAARLTVFTDAARHAWPGTATDGASLDLRGLDVAVVRPDDRSPPNLALKSLRVAPAPEAGTRAITVDFEVEGYNVSPLEGGELVAMLQVDGAPVAKTTAALKGAGPWNRRFTHALPASAGGTVHDLSVKLPEDALEMDNVFALPVRAPREVHVLLVDGDPQTVAWRDELFYLERALRAPVPGGGRLALNVVVQAPTPQEIEAADVVMLCNVRSVPPAAVQALHAHVRRGGGLFISGGDKVDVDFYNGSLMDLLPQPLRGEKSRVELEDPNKREVLGIGQVDTAHAILAPFDGQKPEGLTRAQTHTVLLLETGGKAPREVLMRFSNGAPALLERRVGPGKVLLLTTTVDRDWSDLAIRPGFLPLMQQAVLYLADALADSRPRHVHLGQTHTISIRRGAAHLAVEAPSGVRMDLPVQPEDNRVEVRGLKELGTHRVFMSPDEGDAVEVPFERFAVWPDTSESDLTPLTDDELAARMPRGAQFLRGNADLTPPEQPVWPLLLAALALLLLAEGVLARRG